MKLPIYFYCLALFLSLTLCACQKIKAPTITQGQEEQEEMLQHTPEFKTASHGKKYLHSADKDLCFVCHEKRERNSKGNSQGKTKTCYACHGVFPHPEGYTSRDQHGKDALLQSQNCVICHRESRSDSLVPSCRDCHEDYPHSRDFADGEVHARAYFRSEKSCKGCHGDQLQGVGQSIACSSCHTKIHSEEFKRTRVHGQVDQVNGKSCSACHSQESRSCSLCHSAYPHPSGFDDPKLHAPLYRKNGLDCLKCHTSSDKSNAPSCLGCHNYPHSKTWAKASEHGQAYRKDDCFECHAKAVSTAGGKSSGVTCSDCHLWHLKPENEQETIPGVHYHIYQGKMAKFGCQTCHQDESKDACFRCHDSSTEMVVRWRDPAIELKAKKR